ncbi:MAG: aminopeptidase [Bacilli bacterium]
MENLNHLLEKYAELAIKVGVNLQPGKPLVIRSTIEAAPFTREATRIAYEQGASHVYVDWSDDTITRTKFLLAKDEAFDYFPEWQVNKELALCEEGASYLSVYCPNPNLYDGVDPKRVARQAKSSATALTKFRERLMNDNNAWSIVAVPTVEWVKKLFPDSSVEEGTEKMWEQIFSICRIDQADPIAAWQEHNAKLQAMVEKLNNKRFKTLVYKSATADLRIDLPAEHVWKGGGAVTTDGVFFNPNIPTEEVFTMPHKDGVNGWVKSTLPFNYRGTLIEGMELHFKDGVVTEAKADTNNEALQLMLESDEGARRLGEVALVPYESPIRESGHIFFNTLYDENASCHLALGKAYPTNIEKGDTLSKEQLDALGVNDSLIHEDFMIGSQDLSIDGETADGQSIAVFRNGTWAL